VSSSPRLCKPAASPGFGRKVGRGPPAAAWTTRAEMSWPGPQPGDASRCRLPPQASLDVAQRRAGCRCGAGGRRDGPLSLVPLVPVNSKSRGGGGRVWAGFPSTVSWAPGGQCRVRHPGARTEITRSAFIIAVTGAPRDVGTGSSSSAPRDCHRRGTVEGEIAQSREMQSGSGRRHSSAHKGTRRYWPPPLADSTVLVGQQMR
jgi:hypothetical protein